MFRDWTRDAREEARISKCSFNLVTFDAFVDFGIANTSSRSYIRPGWFVSFGRRVHRNDARHRRIVEASHRVASRRAVVPHHPTTICLPMRVCPSLCERIFSRVYVYGYTAIRFQRRLRANRYV